NVWLRAKSSNGSDRISCLKNGNKIGAKSCIKSCVNCSRNNEVTVAGEFSKSCNNEAMVAGKSGKIRNEAGAASAVAYEDAPALKCCTNWSLNAAAWAAIA